MNKFDNKIDTILNEFIGGALAGAVGAASGFVKGATSKDPIGDVVKAGVDLYKSGKEGENKPIGEGNPPKMDMYVKSQDNPDLIGRITEISNNKNNFKVQLVGMNPATEEEMKSGKVDLHSKETSSGSEYVIVKTINNGKWHIVTNQKAQKLQSGTGVDDYGKRDSILNDKDGNPLVTSVTWAGKGTTFPNWVEYKGI